MSLLTARTIRLVIFLKSPMGILRLVFQEQISIGITIKLTEWQTII